MHGVQGKKFVVAEKNWSQYIPHLHVHCINGRCNLSVGAQQNDSLDSGHRVVRWEKLINEGKWRCTFIKGEEATCYLSLKVQIEGELICSQ